MSAEAEAGAHTGPHRDYVGAKLGMWIFIFTELILFGGLFVAYGMYRAMHSHEFHHAAGEWGDGGDRGLVDVARHGC